MFDLYPYSVVFVTLCVQTRVRGRVRGDTAKHRKREMDKGGAISFIRVKFIRALSQRTNERSNQRRKFYVNG